MACNGDRSNFIRADAYGRLRDLVALTILLPRPDCMKSLSNSTRLKPLEKKNGLVQVIIEALAGSRNRLAFDPHEGVFAMKKVLPGGMVFRTTLVALGLIKKADKAV
jgi:hypothetical protein